MHLLVVGGSGHVGTITLPLLAKQHRLRIFDLRPPADPTWEYVTGNISDFQALSAAMQGVDALLYMAMGNQAREGDNFLNASFDVNVKGVYMALLAAHQHGIPHAVYTSSMSVYDPLMGRYFPDEEITPDASGIYGFTKRMGEECCRAATREWGMSVNALRLCLPRSEEVWMAETRLGTPTISTTAGDVARALLGALAYQGNGFQAFMISGDYEQQMMNMSKAKRLLGWEPLARPKQ